MERKRKRKPMGLSARRGTRQGGDDIVVNCDAMGQCLKVVADWMLHGVQAGYIRVVFDPSPEEGVVDPSFELDILLDWRLGFDSALGREDWSLVPSPNVPDAP